jgi:hypothetical protein
MPDIATDCLKKNYGTIVEGPQGFRLPEKTARAIEEASKGLPADFTYRRRTFSTKNENVDADERTEVSVITSDAVDRDKECVLPSGGNWSTFNKVVPFAHKYDQLPAGYNLWIRPDGRTIKAKTQYPTKPEDWGDAPWMPSAIWHFINQPVPTLGDKSIGFLPLNIRGATLEEKSKRPELKDVPVIDKWIGLEYSVVPIPCNPEAQLVTVGKMLGEIEPALAGLFADVFGIDLKAIGAQDGKTGYQAVVDDDKGEAMPACPKCLSPDKVTRKDGGDMYTCGVCNLDFSPAMEAKIAAALAAPFVAAETYLEQERRRARERRDWAAAETIRQINLALAAAAGRV